jgi:hypothetical protein
MDDKSDNTNPATGGNDAPSQAGTGNAAGEPVAGADPPIVIQGGGGNAPVAGADPPIVIQGGGGSSGSSGSGSGSGNIDG